MWMALCTTAFTLCVATRSRCSPSDKRLAAVFTGSSRPFSGDVPVQTDLADQAIAVPVRCRVSLCSQEIALMHSST